MLLKNLGSIPLESPPFGEKMVGKPHINSGSLSKRVISMVEIGMVLKGSPSIFH